MELPSAVLAEEVSRLAIRFRVLEWHQQVEHFDNLGTDGLNRTRRNDKDEVVAADVTDKPLLTAQAFHDVMQYTGQYAYHTVPFVVTVSIVELLEVIEIGIRHSKNRLFGQLPGDAGLDDIRSGQARGRVDMNVAVRPCEHRVQAAVHFGGWRDFSQDFIGTGGETSLYIASRCVAEYDRGHHRRIRVSLDARTGLFHPGGSGACIEEHEARPSAQTPRHEFVHCRDRDRQKFVGTEPVRRRVGKGGTLIRQNKG